MRGKVNVKKKVLTFAVLAIWALASNLSAQSKGITHQVVTFKRKKIILYKESHALLIGVSKYKYWPRLENIPREMELLESALKKHGFHVQKHLDLTCTKLKNTIENFINKFGFTPNNRLLIFFSGHGYTRKDGKKGYIVPADAVDPRDDEIGFAQKAIEMEQIITWARRIESKHALFVFDSCFPGTIFQTRTSSTPAYISYLTGKPVRQFITAGSAGETIPSESYFTTCFISGIEGKADDDRDGYITVTELGRHLQKRIIGYKIGQTPQFGKIRDPELDQGDFVFISKSSPPETVAVGIMAKEKKKNKKRISPFLIAGGIVVAGIITLIVINNSSKRINDVEARITNADDRAEMYVNGRKVLTISYAEGPEGISVVNQPGYTDWVNIDQHIKKGPNTFRVTVWNADTPGSASGNFYVRHNGKMLLEKNFYQDTGTEGIKYDVTITISF